VSGERIEVVGPLKWIVVQCFKNARSAYDSVGKCLSMAEVSSDYLISEQC